MTCANCTCRTTCRSLCYEMRRLLKPASKDREVIVSSTLIEPLGRIGRIYAPRCGSTYVSHLTWTEAQTGEWPPDEWNHDKRMAFDHLCNELTMAEVARRYRVKEHVARYKIDKIRKSPQTLTS